MASDYENEVARRRQARQTGRQINPQGAAPPGSGSGSPLSGLGGTLEKVGRAAIGENADRAGNVYDRTAGAGEQALGLQSRGQQQELSGAVMDRALGRGGPSVAEMQLGRSQAEAQNQARSFASSARGGNVALANRMAASGQAQAMGQAGEQGAMLRAQEQIAAQQLASQQLQAQRQQDLLARGYSGEEAKAASEAHLKAEEINARISEGNAQRKQGPALAGIAALGGLITSSDVRAKENVRETPMYSDFVTKDIYEPPPPAPTPSVLARNANAPPVGQQLVVAAPPQADNAAAEQLAAMKQNRLLEAMGSNQAPAGGDAGSSITSGLALGSMLSDFAAKDVAESRRDLAPVRDVTYTYKPDHSARMAAELSDDPQEQAFAFADKRTPRRGIIAQDLERSPAFDDSVVETPAGKAVLKDRALSEALGQMAGLDKRLRLVERMGGV
jgi:hypothetical protein